MKLEDARKLYDEGVDSSRKSVFYNTFSYPTKISPESIALFIATHSKPGDTILDVFGGSGSTGIAAKLCSSPTEEMIKTSERMGLSTIWGTRNCVLMDIGVYASFASEVICNPPDTNEFDKAFDDFIGFARDELLNMYEIADNDGKHSFIRHIIWTEIIECPSCHKQHSFVECMVEHDPIVIKSNGVCPSCGYSGSRTTFNDVTETVYDSILQTYVKRKVRIPFKIYGVTGKKKWSREATQDDIASMRAIEFEDYCDSEPKKISWGDLYRSGYHLGMTHLHHFYTRRNYNVMTRLWSKTSEYPDKIRDALRLVLLSYNQAHSTLMTRVVAKKNSKDFVLTGAQSGVLYISSLPVEKNIIFGLERKKKCFLESFQLINSCTGHVTVLNSNSEKIPFPDKSIDYVFTDPPFGDFIPYAEVNQINELWLDSVTDREQEIIISPAEGKTDNDYEMMMTSVFKEVHRVLKDKSNATIVFHASKAKVWNALENSILNADFTICTTAILNKIQPSFKQVVSEGSVRGDPLILLYKNGELMRPLPFRPKVTIVSERLADPRIEYSRYVENCLLYNEKIEYDAQTYYSHNRKKET